MKGSVEPRLWAVVDADQRDSRHRPDRVGEALACLTGVPGLRLPFERTAGDEVQALAGEAGAVLETVARLTRLEAAGQAPGWRIGVGIGTLEDLTGVASTRAARGEAYVRAREAVERAGQTPAGVCVLGGGPYAEAALVVLRTLLARRTVKGWEVVDAMAAPGAKQSEVAATLGISESAVSQRLTGALWREVRHAEVLAHHHLGLALGSGETEGER